MPRKMFLGTMAALVLLSAAAIADEVAVANQYRANFDRDSCAAMEMGANFLVEASVRDPRTAAPAWHWQVGEGPLARNVAGLAAGALLDAYRVSGQSRYLTVARRHGDALLAAAAGWNAKNLPYKADIELLARLERMTGNGAYGRAARAGFAVLRSVSPNGAAEVERIWRGRRATAPALLGFDTALGIRAAVALGERRYAYQLADAVLARLDDWYRPRADTRFTLVSAAALTEALQQLDAGHYRKASDRFRAELLRRQRQNGSWMVNETQPSAYAALALADGTPAERRAFARGIAWLKSTMLRRGQFALYNDYMPEPFVGRVISEVHAEAVSALSRACANR